MPDETEVVQDGTEQEVDSEVVESQEETISLDEEIKRFEKDHNRSGFEQRQQKKLEVDPASLDDETLDRLANRILPALKVQNESMLLESKLEKITSDPETRRLVLFHLQNTVNPNAGSLDDRLEIAFAAANRKKILKTSKELITAQRNRQQISNQSQGSNTETRQVQDNLLSQSQIRSLKEKGWSDEKIKRFKDNLKRNPGR